MASNKRFDESISKWLEETAPSQLPERVLEATFERTRTSKQQVGWRALLGRIRLTRFAPALSGAVVIVLAAALALSYYASQQEIAGPANPAPLPATPDVWSRVSIDSRFRTAQVDPDSLASSPHGLLALLGELGSNAFELAVSTDGLTWWQVPSTQHPPLGGNVELIQLIGTDRGFMMIVGNDVWTSPDGLTWERLTGQEDPDLRQGEILDAAAGGQGFVAVGSNNTAWYSTNGSDWSLADVPPPPADFGGPDYTGPPPNVTMYQVATSGAALVAWGYASADNRDETIVEPVVWTSRDGRTWTSVPGPGIDSVALAGRPGSFVATGMLIGGIPAGLANRVAFFSNDGQTWERATNDLESRRPQNPNGGLSKDEPLLTVDAVAAAGSGFVAVGSDGMCLIDPCADAEAAIWTSVDGRSWARMAGDDLFRVNEPSDPNASPGAYATSVVTWGSRFVVGGQYDGKPVIWISGSESPASDGTASPAPAAGTSAPEATQPQPVAFAGNWNATDPPPDRSHLTMDVIALADGTYGVTIRDQVASVCSGVSSTLTAVAVPAESKTIVIAQPEYVCDDGSEAMALSGPPLAEQLRNLGFLYDPGSDELQDSLGLVWSRVAMGP
jgi:hypothetical protein